MAAVSLAKIAPNSLKLEGSSLTVKSEGTANVLSQSLNQDLAAITAAVMVNLAYSQSEFTAQLDLPEGSSAEADNVAVTTDYTANAEAVVTPSAGGAKLSAGSIQVNLAIANADSAGTAAISGSGGSLKAGAIQVLSRGTALSNAYNITPVINIAGAEITSNILLADLDASNEAYIQGVDVSEASIDVKAQLNNTANTGATATLGNSYKTTGGGSVSLVSVEANVAKAENNSKNHAYLKNVTVSDGKAASVLAQGWSYAKAWVEEESVSLYGLSVGVNVVNARANGDFRAYVEGRSGGQINVQSISVKNEYHSLADALSRQPSLGIGAAQVGTNVAYANAGTLAHSYIGGSGSLTSAGNILIETLGDAQAKALIGATAVDMNAVGAAVNVVKAIVSADHQAYIGDAQNAGNPVSDISVSSENGGISLNSRLNVTESGGNITGADAQVGSNYLNSGNASASISIVGGKVSTAEAKMQALASAHIRTMGDIKAKNQLSSQLNAYSGAKGDVIFPAVDINVVGVTVLDTDARAEGEFYSFVDAGNVTVGSLSIHNNYSSVSEAATGSAGGVAVNFVDVGVNNAKSNTATKALAYLRSNGNVVVNGAADILAQAGKLEAMANGRERKINVSGVKVAVNQVEAVLGGEQKAFVEVQGDMTAYRKMTVQSLIKDSKAEAVNGYTGGGSGVSVGFVDVKVNKSDAKSKTSNEAYIKGIGAEAAIKAAALELTAKSFTEAEARTASGIDVGVAATVGVFESASSTSDAVSAWLENVAVESGGDVVVEAIGNTASNAAANTGGGGGLLNTDSSTASASVGSGSNDTQKVSVQVKGGSITADGDIELRSYNTGEAKAEIRKGISVGIIGNINDKALPTNAWYTTEVLVTDGAQLISTGGSVNIISEDSAAAESRVSSNSIGGGFNADHTYGSNTVTINNNINISGLLDAYEAAIIKAFSKANMKAETYADGGGLITGTALTAENVLNRKVKVTIDNGSSITANYGDIDILAAGGSEDSVVTISKISSGGLVAMGYATLITDIDSNVSTSVGSGAEIRSRFNTVNINAEASQTGVESTASVDASGLGVRPKASATVTLDLTADVQVGKTDGLQTIIEARDVNIISHIAQLYVYINMYSKGSALGADIDATSTPISNLIARVNVLNADITGHDSTTVYSSTRPDFREANIDVRATVQLNALGEAVAKANGKTIAANGTIIGPDVIFRGARLSVTDYEFDPDRVDVTLKKGGAIVKKTENRQWFSSTGSTIVDGGTQLYLSDAAAGIYIDVSYYNGALTIREVGVKDPNKFYDASGSGNIIFLDIFNNLQGQAFIYADNGNEVTLKVYDQAMLPRVIITNSTDRGITLNAIYTSNEGYIKPAVFGVGSYIEAVDYDAPEIEVLTSGGGNVYVNGFISNHEGPVSFIWTGDKRGSLDAVKEVTNISSGTSVYPIWAHELVVEGPATMGTEDNYFNFYTFSGSNGRVYTESIGDVYVNVIPVILYVVDKAGKTIEEHTDPVIIERVVSLEGNVYLNLLDGVEATMVAGSNTVTIPQPGTLSYITDAADIRLTADCTLTGKSVLDRYIQSYDAASGLYSYLLPNGTVFYMDSYGNVSRIEEGGTQTAVGEYEFIEDGSGNVVEIRLAKGISINLRTGQLSVEEDSSYEVLMESVVDDWWGIAEGSPKVTIRLSEEYDTGEKDKDNNPIMAVHEWDVSLKKVTIGKDLDYYLLSGFEPTMDKLEQKENFYILVHDKAAGSMSFFILEGNGLNEQEATEQSQDQFYQDKLIIDDGSSVHTNRLNNGNTYYEAQFDPAFRDRHSAGPVKNLYDLKKNASKEFTIENFLGTGQNVTWKADANDNEKLWIGDTSFAVKSIPGLGYVIDPEIKVDALYQDFVDQIKNMVWSADVTTTQLSEARTDKGIKVGTNYTSVNGAPKNAFYFTEFNYYRQNDNGTQTQMYKLNWYYMYGYDLSIRYVEMQPASATLSMEYHESGTSYVLDDNTTVYVEPGTGKLYATYDQETGEFSDELVLTEEQRSEIRYKFLDANGEPLSFEGKELWSYKQTKADIQYNGQDCYLIDSHPEFNIYVVYEGGSYKIVMRTINGVTQVQPTGSSVSFDKKSFTIKVDDKDTTLTITLVDGQDTYTAESGDNTYTFTRTTDEDGKETWTYTVKDKEGEVSAATDITPDTPDPAAETTTKYKLQVLQYSGSSKKDEWKDYIKDNEQIYIDLLNNPTNTGLEYKLYTLSGTTFAEVTGVSVIYRNGIYQLNDSSQNFAQAQVDGKDLIASKEEKTTYTEETGRTLLKYVGKDEYLKDTSNNNVNFDDMEMSNYKTNSDISSGKLILRPGGVEGADDGNDVGSGGSSALDSGKSVLLIIGPLDNIDIREVDIPENQMMDNGQRITKGYVISDTMYLTRSGLVLNIKGDFSAKFDGDTYTSTRIIASQLGDLGEKRELTYNNEGKVMYDGVEYTLYNNTLTYVDENGAIAQCDPDKTMEILYSVKPSDNSDGPKVIFLKDQNIYLERLTDVIAKDFTGKYYYNTSGNNWVPADYEELSGQVDYSSYKDGRIIQERKYRLVGKVSYGGTVYLTISEDGDEIYYELNQLNLVTGSDGSVFSTDPDAQFSQTLKANEQDEVLYHMGYVETKGEGKQIIINMENRKGTLRDGDELLGQLDPDVYTEDDMDIRTNNGDVIIYSHSSGSIGTADDPLEISTGTGELIFLNLEGEKVLSTDTYISSEEDITLDPDIVVDNVTLDVDSGKNIYGTELDAINGGVIDLDAGDDIRFKRISSSDGSGTIDLDAKGVVGRLLPDGSDAVIFINETNTSTVAPDAKPVLSVSGDKSIGEVDSSLIVDIPESLTMEIPRAGDIWMEAKDLDYVPPQQAGGRDEEGSRIEGDLIDDLDDEDGVFSTALSAQTPEELAEYFLSSLDNDPDSQESKDYRLRLEELVTETLTEEQITELLEKLTDGEGAGDTGSWDEEPDIKPELWTKEQFVKLLSAALEEEDEEGNLIVKDETIILLYWDAMSDEEKRALIADDGSFWEDVDYPEPVEDTRDFRDFSAHIGESKGETSLINNGSITITQDTGTLTAKDIVSVYEDVSLTAPYIKGAEESYEKANVTGSIIELTATAIDGSILDLTTDQQDWIEHTVANLDGVDTDPVSGEYVVPENMPTGGGSWTISRNPQSGELEMSFEVDFTSISVRENDVPTSLTATAPGDIEITELSGDLGVNEVSSTNGGKVSLTVTQGDLTDTNPDTNGLNISTEGSAELTVQQGTIGSRDNPIDVQVGGILNTDSKGDTFISTGEDLTMVGDSEDGKLNVQADKDLNLSNTQGDMNVNELDVGGNADVSSPNGINIDNAQVDGDLDVNANGGSLNVDQAQVGGDMEADSQGDMNIGQIHVGGNMDTSSAGDTDVGQLQVDGLVSMDSQGDITVDKTTGDITVDKITADGDILLNLDDKISDNSPDFIKELAQAQAENAQAQAELEALKQRLETEREYLEPLEDSIDQLESLKKELQADKAELENQTPTTETERLEIEKQLKDIEDKLDNIDGELQELLDKYQPEKAYEDQLLQEKADAEKKADAAEQKLEEAREKAENASASITAGGDLNITMENGGTIGEEDNSLSINVGGTVSIESGDDAELEGIYLESLNDEALKTDPMTAGEIRIDSIGDIDPTNDDGKSSFTAEDLTLNSISGDTGTKEEPIYTYADTISAMGENVNIINLKDTQIDQIIAEDEANIKSEGDISRADPQSDDNNIISGSTDLTADGDIGSKDEPIKIQTDEFSGEGDNVYIDSDGDIVIDHIDAEDDVVITADGSVTDKPENEGKPAIDSENLEIHAGGTVGKEDNPLDIDVPGDIDVTSRLDLVFLRLHGLSRPWMSWPERTNHPAYLFADQEGRIRPDAPLTRGEAAQMIYILLGMPEGQYMENPFRDLGSDDPLFQAILTLYYMGAFEGWQLEELFQSDREITRAEFISLLVWFYCRMGGEVQQAPDMDIADMDASHWAYEAVLTALDQGWIELDENAAFRPDDTITRGEAAAAANRAAGREPDMEILEPMNPGFADLPEDHPFYEDILEAAITHPAGHYLSAAGL